MLHNFQKEYVINRARARARGRFRTEQEFGLVLGIGLVMRYRHSATHNSSPHFNGRLLVTLDTSLNLHYLLREDVEGLLPPESPTDTLYSIILRRYFKLY